MSDAASNLLASTTTLNPVARLAVSKAISDETLKKDGTRNAVAPGTYEVDIAVRIKGMLKIGADTTTDVPVDPPMAAALLLLLRGRMSEEKILAALPAALREAHEEEKRAKGEKPEPTAFDAALQGVASTFAKQVKAEIGKVPRKGSVTATLKVDPA
jgi:hypothetical protein